MSDLDLEPHGAPGPKSLRLSPRVGVVAVVWFGAVVAGFAWLLSYSFSSPLGAEAPDSWPESTTLDFETGTPALVMLAHPRCPCTRASLGALEKIALRCGSNLHTHVVFVLPPEGAAANADLQAWTESGLWQRAERIPGVRVHPDPGGQEARRFRGTTSGEVALYDVDGQLVFQGGLTASRGHWGDSRGGAAVLEHVLGGVSPIERAPAFGCPLFESQPQQTEINT